MHGRKEVEWKETRGGEDETLEPFLVKAEWADGGWEFFDRSLMDLAGIYCPMATTRELVARAECEWALRSLENDDGVADRPVTGVEPAFVGLATSRRDQKDVSPTRRDASMAGWDRQLLPEASHRS